MSQLTVAETIVIGDISSALAGNDNSAGALFGKRLGSPNSPVTIRMAADGLQWAVDGGLLTSAELRDLANYVVWLCGKYTFEAQNLIGAGGSVSILIPGALRPARIDFTVSASSYFPTASTGGSISNFLGYNLEFIRGGISQSTETTEPSYFAWNRSTATLSIYPALGAGEVIALIPT